MNVFFARSITKVPDASRKDYAEGLSSIVEYLRSGMGWSVAWGIDAAAPIDRESRDPSEMQKLFSWYEKLIEQSDLLIADVTFPSLGVGLELAIASQRDIEIWLTTNSKFCRSRDVSLMVLGVPSVKRVIEYTSTSDFAKAGQFGVLEPER